MAAVSSSTSPKSSEEMKDLKITVSTKSEPVVTGSAQKSENEAESPSSSSTSTSSSTSSSTKSEKKKKNKNKNKSEKERNKNNEKKMIILKSADDKEFEVEESIVMLSETIKHMIEDDCADDGIPLPNVTGDVLEKVIVFLKIHGPAMEYLCKPGTIDVKDEIDREEYEKAVAKLMEFDEEFIDGLESDQALFDLIFAANYLAIRNLMECTCQVVADKIREMTPEQVRAYLRIENDYSPEQEAKVRADNAWAFQ